MNTLLKITKPIAIVILIPFTVFCLGGNAYSQKIIPASITDITIPADTLIEGEPEAADTQSLLPEVDISDPVIEAKASELGNDAVRIYEFVRNNIDYEPYFGSKKGAGRTLLDKKGNDFDIASLLIALLRRSNIPARYEYGRIEIPKDKAKEWLNVDNDQALMSILLENNNPAYLSGNTVILDHAWVKAWINYIPYRGAKKVTQDTEKYLF